MIENKNFKTMNLQSQVSYRKLQIHNIMATTKLDVLL